ncbi:MAG: TnsA-like heteromeric transposase endonuclease subunit [Leifsonia sp.]
MLPLERTSPIRTFPTYQGKRSYSGAFYSAPVAGHVVFESLFERAVLMSLEVDDQVVSLAAQPLLLRWPGGGRQWHVPDFFVRLSTGQGRLMDARPRERITERAARLFEATRQVCEQAELEYEVVSDLSWATQANLGFLSNFRDRDFAPSATVASLRGWRGTVGELAALLSPLDPAAGFGSVYWMLWCGRARTDLAIMLSSSTPVEVVR